MLTKLGYLIDNPWSNALDRARQAGAVLAQIILKKHLGVRPVSLIGFSLGARVIFYALIELAKLGAFGVVEEVYLFGATVTASKRVWRQVRGVVAGRFVNAFAMNDWVLGYLFRATSGGLNTVAGLRPIEHIPDLENIDITKILLGHMSYRSLMPKLLEFVGFKMTANHFDEPEEMDLDQPTREMISVEQEREREEKRERNKFGGGGIFGGLRLPGGGGSQEGSKRASREDFGEELPPREEGEKGKQGKRSSEELKLSNFDQSNDFDDNDPPELEGKGEKEKGDSTVVQEEEVEEVGFDFTKLRQELAAGSTLDPIESFPSSSSVVPSSSTTLDSQRALGQEWGTILSEGGESLKVGQEEWVPSISDDDTSLPTSLGFTPFSSALGHVVGGAEGGWTNEEDDITLSVENSRKGFGWGKEEERNQNPW